MESRKALHLIEEFKKNKRDFEKLGFE